MTEQKCPLCLIPTKESVLYEDNKIYLVSTKELKGHKVRIMVVTKRHTTQPTFDEEVIADAVLIDYMTDLMHRQDWYIVSNQHATIPEHWHRIACDAPSEDEVDPLFNQTQKVHFPLKEKKVLIGIPAYNEGVTLPAIITQSQKYGDVLVVDDGSTDNTQQILSFFELKTIKHEKNLGYGTSIQEIFQFAKKNNYDTLITLDADEQHDPSEIPRFLKEMSVSDVVTGNRFLNKNNTPSYRKFGIKTISKLSGIGDAQCGFRTYNKKAISLLTNNLYEKGMGISVEILQLIQSKHLLIIEIPCTINYDHTDHSQNPFSHGFDVIKAFFWGLIWEKPTKFLLPVGLFFFLITLISGIQTLNLYIQYHSIVLSWAILTSGSIVCSILIFNILTFILIFKNKKEEIK